MKYVIDDLSVEEMNIIAAGLNELPLKHSGALFVKIQAKVAAQDKAAADKAKPSTETPA